MESGLPLKSEWWDLLIVLPDATVWERSSWWCPQTISTPRKWRSRHHMLMVWSCLALLDAPALLFSCWCCFHVCWCLLSMPHSYRSSSANFSRCPLMGWISHRTCSATMSNSVASMRSIAPVEPTKSTQKYVEADARWCAYTMWDTQGAWTLGPSPCHLQMPSQQRPTHTHTKPARNITKPMKSEAAQGT